MFRFLLFFALLLTPIQAKPRRLDGKMTWYSMDDNNSKIGSRDNMLRLFKSVATNPESDIPFGTRIYIPALRGMPLGGGRHDGWVRVEDTCRGGPCQFLDLYVGTNGHRDFYRKWMKSKHPTHDPDLFPIKAFIY